MRDPLEHLLDDWRAPTPSVALREAVLAAAPGARIAPVLGRLWAWATAGSLAAACAAGVMAGVWLGPVTPAADDGSTVSALLSPYDPAADLPDNGVLG